MRHYISIFLFILSTNMVAWSKVAIEKQPIPKWVEKIEYKASEIILDDSISQGYNYALNDMQIHVGKQVSFYHYVRRIYNEIGVQNASEIMVNYDPSFEKLVFHEVRIIRNGKIIDRLDLSKIKLHQDESQKGSYIYNGQLSALLILEDVRVEDVIEYSFSIIGFNPVYKGMFSTSFYLQFYEFTSQINRRIVIHQSRKLNIKEELTKTKPVIKETPEGEREYKWYFENVEGLQLDVDVPGWYDAYPFVMVSEYSSWEELVNWANELYKYDSNKTVVGLQRVIDRIKKDNVTPALRAIAALRFVQDSIRYTGIENGVWSFKPFAPETVYKLRYGDCKGKVLLYCYILSKLNIKAYPALVNTYYRQEVKKWLPSPSVFNHCIVVVELNAKLYWYDPTRSFQKGDFDKIYFPNFQQALILKENMKSLTDIITYNVSKANIIEKYNIGKVGNGVSLNVLSEYEGYDAENNRYYFNNNTKKEIEKNYLNFYAKNFPFIKSEGLIISGDTMNGNIFRTEEKYFIDSFWVKPNAEKKYYYECSVYAQNIIDKMYIPATAIRTMPLTIEYPLEINHVAELYLPETWAVKDEAISISGPGISFSKKVTYKSNIIRIENSFKTTKEYITAEETAEYIKKINQINNNLGYSLQYDSGVLNNDKNLSWQMISLAIFSLILSILGCYFIYNFNPEVKYFEYKEEKIGGWLALFAVGVTISPFSLLYMMYGNDYFNEYSWNLYADSQSSFYNIPMVLFNIFNMAANILLFTMSVLFAVLFFSKRSSVPVVYAFYSGYNIVFLMVNSYFLSSFNFEQEAMDGYKQIGRTLLQGAIWIPYLFISKRSKNTFLVRL